MLLAQQRYDQPENRQATGGEDRGVMHGGLREMKQAPEMGACERYKKHFQNLSHINYLIMPQFWDLFSMEL